MLADHLRPSARNCALALTLIGALATLGCSGQPGLGQPRPALETSTYLVTPRWAPDGASLLVSARGGVGLSILDLKGGTLRAVDPTHRGPATFAPAGDRVAFQSAPETFGEYRIRPGKLRLSNQRPAYLRSPARTLQGELVADVAGAQVYFDRYTGGISRVTSAGTQLIHHLGAWGVEVSRSGEIAFCTGHLPQARLHVWTAAAGASDVGPGAQPAWLPDGSAVVYVVARWAEQGAVPQAADLWAYDPRAGRSVQLTHTASILEMEPAPSPDGGRLAFADWGRGTIFVADWRGLPE